MLVARDEWGRINQEVGDALVKAGVITTQERRDYAVGDFDDNALTQWHEKWKPLRPLFNKEAGLLDRMANWEAHYKTQSIRKDFMVCVRHNDALGIIASIHYQPQKDRILLQLLERHPEKTELKGLPRPFAYEMLRSIAHLRGVSTIAVAGLSLQTGYESLHDRLGFKQVENEHTYTRAANTPINWRSALNPK